MIPDERALLYHILALSFACPEAGLAERLTRLVGELRLETWDGDSEGRPILPIAPFIRVLATLDSSKLRELRQECQRLFAQGRPGALCPAHEWAYCPETSPEAVAQAVQRSYTAWDQVVNPASTNHISTELEFLAYLSHRVDDEAAQVAKRDFLHRHTLGWLPEFADKVAAMTRLDFYRAAAHLLVAFLKLETGSPFGPV